MHRCTDWDWEETLLEGGELFPGLSEELCMELEEMEDLDVLWQVPDRAELRNHDCMWAGLCVSEKHEREGARLERPYPPPAVKRPKVIAPTNSRSVLLPPPPRLPDRPDTPLSDNELELDLPYLCDLLGEQWVSSVMPSEVTGQTTAPPPRPPSPPPQPPQSRSYYTHPISDHCYYSTMPPSHHVHPDSLGVQTPSDSEEEIDVETVAEARKPGRGACSPCGMPTDPTPQDKRVLQRTVSSMMRRSGPSLKHERRRRKRRYSSTSGHDYECEARLVKRKQYRSLKNKRKRRHNVRPSSSDSEIESTEKRSMHNNLERQRRIDLRNAFEELRLLVPETEEHEKAAKVQILSAGAEFCMSLEEDERALLTEKGALKRQQERLRDRLASLRRTLARAR